MATHKYAAPEFTGTALEMFFNYEPDTGFFRHKTYRGPRSTGPGGIAGAKMRHGYVAIGLPGGKLVTAHRLAWLWMTGEWPSGEIDHINGDRADNRFSNLRMADRVRNARNGGLRRTNTSGHIGVGWDRAKNKWKASITLAGRTLHLGRFDAIEDAIVARKAAEQKHFGEFSPSGHVGYPER